MPADPYKRAFEMKLCGLALSGGGIRSATFNLGVLQALAELRLLPEIDYLSTVSGGGYIGSWLAAWILREGSIHSVQSTLAPNTAPNPLSDTYRPVRFLREYSSYLTPQRGLFSTDTWAMVAVYIRNLFLNQIVLVLVLGALLQIPLIFWPVLALEGAEIWLLAIWVAGLLWSGCWAYGEKVSTKDEPSRGHVFGALALPIAVAAGAESFALWFQHVAWAHTFLIFGVGVLWLFIALFPDNPTTRKLLIRLLAALVGWAFFWATVTLLAKLFDYWSVNALTGEWKVLAFGPALVLAIFCVTLILAVGIVGDSMEDDEREWWSRLGALLGKICVVYLVCASTAIYGPLLVHKSVQLRWSLATIWPVVSWLGAQFGAEPDTGIGQSSSSPKRLLRAAIALVAPWVFIAGVLLMVSWLMFWLSGMWHFGWEWGSSHLFQHYWQTMAEEYWHRLALSGGFLVLGGILGWRVDVNEFSMHHFYKNRLVRAFLAASRRRRYRSPNAFTGFDPTDDIPLRSFRPQTATQGSEQPFELAPNYKGPFQILNAALNVTAGADLALQERRAESFTFTPLRCGFQYSRPRTSDAEKVVREAAYRPTELFGYQNGVTLGTALAISGAATNPNQGSHSNPATASLMTLFNIRLGWWFGNPAGTFSWRRSSPPLGLAYLLYELMGHARDDQKYVNLSDGGHFDNSGIYELVRRRCKYIIVCDAEQDTGFGFDGIANAMRKCRIDFAARVDLDIRNLVPVPGAASKCHCAFGKITYDDGGEGFILYLKSSLDGREPTDISAFKHKCRDFPHESTTNQFFVESRFESYRELGFHAAMDALQNCVRVANNPQQGQAGKPFMERLFGHLREMWPNPSAVDGSARQHTDKLLFSSFATAGTWQEFRMRIAMVYRIYLDLHLEKECDRSANKGVIKVLKQWKSDPGQASAWRDTKQEYSTPFQRFYDEELQ